MNKTAKYSIILMLSTMFAKMLGFGREISLAYVYGASATSDAFLLAYSIPTIIFAGIGSAILTGYISIYTRIDYDNHENAKQFTNNVTSIVFLLSAALICIFLIFDKPIVKIFAVGFKGELLDKTVILADTMMISLLFIGVYFVLQGYLQLHDGFLAVGLVSVPLNICVIISILVSSEKNYKILGYGVVMGYAMSFLMLLIASMKRGYRYKPVLKLDRHIKQLTYIIFPIFWGKAITQLNYMIDKSIASVLPYGSISALSYGNRILGFISAVFVISIATAIFPKMSSLSAEQDMDELKNMFGSSVGIMSLLVVPISMGMMLFSDEIIQIIFMRGAFDVEAVKSTGQVLFFYSFGLLAFSIKDVMINVYYAIGDSKTPMVNSIIALAINTAMNLMVVRRLGHSGLALATSVSGIITLVILALDLRKKIGSMGYRKMSLSVIKMFVATIIMGVAIKPLYELLLRLNGSVLISLVISVLAGIIIYGLSCVLLKVKEMNMVVDTVKQKLGRKKA